MQHWTGPSAHFAHKCVRTIHELRDLSHEPLSHVFDTTHVVVARGHAYSLARLASALECASVLVSACM
jgi:hypothetical protein